MFSISRIASSNFSLLGKGTQVGSAFNKNKRWAIWDPPTKINAFTTYICPKHADSLRHLDGAPRLNHLGEELVAPRGVALLSVRLVDLVRDVLLDVHRLRRVELQLEAVAARALEARVDP